MSADAGLRALAAAARQAAEGLEVTVRDAGGGGLPAAEVLEAFGQALALLERLADPERARAEREALETLAAQAAQLLEALALAAGAAGRGAGAAVLETLQVPLALWVAARGGRLRELAPAVNGCARLANGLREPGALGELADTMARLAEAADPAVREAPDAGQPGHPWRTLLVNRAIVATRSHDPGRMERAFADLTAALPDAAPAFFAEGMREMDRLGYPLHVRAVMARWHARHGGGGLH